MYYTYILESMRNPDKRYIGHTGDLRKRLEAHNAGKCRYTAGFRPWRVKVYMAFEDREIARRFEKYLKSGSGHAFSNRHF